jgi:hypothetical protein
MSQSAPTGGRNLSLWLQKVRAGDVLKKKRLKLLGVSLGDWIVCAECKHQQAHHYQHGGDFAQSCWNCNADHYKFVYFDELAKSLPPEAVLYRLNRR